jgi:hypothetical protein
MRYDVALDPTWLLQFGKEITPREALHLQRMDDLSIIHTLYEIGSRAAKEQIKAEHLFGDLDTPQPVASS